LKKLPIGAVPSDSFKRTGIPSKKYINSDLKKKRKKKR